MSGAAATCGRIVFVDRHPVPRAAVAALVRAAAPDWLVEEFDSPQQALDRIPGAGLLLCGGSTGAVLGPRWIHDLVELVRPGKMVILGASQERRVCAQALEGGAWGHIPLTSSADVISAAFRLILAGGTYFPALHPMRLTPDGLATPEVVAFSPRQLEVLPLLEQGHSNREIGVRLGISTPTAKLHVQAILKKLGAKNRTEAARLVRENGL